MEEALAVNKMLVAIFSSVIGWGGFIAIIWMCRGFIITGITMGAITFLTRNGNEDLKRLIIKNLTDKNLPLEVLYKELDEHFKKEGFGGRS